MAHDHGHAPVRATFLSASAPARFAIVSGPVVLLWLAVWWALA